MAYKASYKPGQLVKLDLDFEHPADIESVKAVFIPEFGQGMPVTLKADRSSVDQKDKEHTKKHCAVLNGLITKENRPGSYRCINITATTPGGRELKPDQLFESITFDVDEEPGEDLFQLTGTRVH